MCGDNKDGDINKVDEMEEDVGYMGDFLWNNWETIGDDEGIQVPKEDDHYNGRHRLKDRIEDNFSTISQCIFEATCMDRFFLKTYCTVK